MAKQLQKQQEKQGLGAVQGQKNNIESTEAAYPMSYTAGYENGYEAYPPLYGEGEVAEVERVEAGQENNEQGVVETTGLAPLQQTPALALNAEESLDGMSAGLQVESSESSSAGDAAGGGGSGSGTVGPTPPPIAPTDDPDFNAVEEKIVAGGEQYKEHEAAASLSKNAELAAPLAEGEQEGLAEQGQINKMDAQEPAAFNAEQFVGALMNRIAAIMPKTEKEADNFERNDGLGKMSQTVSAEVGKEKQAAEHAIEGASEEAPQVGAVSARTVEQLEGPELGPVAAPVGGGAAIPDAREAVYVENVVDDRLGEIDSLMESNEVKDEQLAASNEASFLTALGEKEGAKTGSEEMKTAVRLEETGILSAAAGNSEQLALSEMDALHTERELFLQNVLGEQEDSSAEQTAERAKVASEIHSIYERSKSEVEQQLSSLDQEVQNMFDQAAAKAKAKFLSHVQTKMAAYKAERYEGLSGAARWLGDAFTGLPEEVNAFYVEGRELYIAEMRQALYQIADHIAAGLNAAKARIQAGREEVTAYVESLPDAVRALGEKAAAAIDRSFGELDASVNSKQDALVNELAKQYTDNLAAIDAEIAAMQEANKGLIDHALEAVGGVIETIMEIKQMLTDVVNAGVEVISAILADPIGFLSNLIDGVSAGVNGFFANVSDHLLNGLIEWLTGALSGVNISLPEDIFSFAGILDLSAQILGLSWDYVREKAVYAVGEDAVSAMESSFEIFKILQTEGLAGAWEYIQGQLGNLQEVVLGGIQEFLITAVFQAGIEWIIGLLTPAGAFVKAAMAIIDIVKFFIENGSQIMALVQSIIDSLAAIAAGDVGFVAQAVEGAMASTVPILIDFLASLLGIDGLSDKVQEIVGSIRKRIDDAITGLIDKAKAWFKGKGKDKRKAENEKEVTDEDRAKHKRFAAEIEADLKKIQPKEGESFEDFRQRVQIRANELEKQYQPKLTDGIKVSIQLTSTAKEDEKDGDVDVKVRIAPNTTEEITNIEFTSSSTKKNDQNLIEDLESLVKDSYDKSGGFFSEKTEEKIQAKFDKIYAEIIKEINDCIGAKLEDYVGVSYTDSGQKLERIIYVRRKVANKKPYEVGKVVVSFTDAEYKTRTLKETEGVANPVYLDQESQKEVVKDRIEQYIPRKGFRYVNERDAKALNKKEKKDLKSLGTADKNELEHMMTSKDSTRLSTTVEGKSQIVGADGNSFNSQGRVDIDYAQIPRDELSAVYTKKGLETYVKGNLPKTNKGKIKKERELQAFIDGIRTKEVIIGKAKKKGTIPKNAHTNYLGKASVDREYPSLLTESDEMIGKIKSFKSKLKKDKELDPDEVINEFLNAK